MPKLGAYDIRLCCFLPEVTKGEKHETTGDSITTKKDLRYSF